MCKHKLVILLYLMIHQFCVSQNPCGELDLLSTNDTTICNDQTIVIIANPGFDTYTWDTGSNDQAINISNTGTYTVSTSFTTNNLVTNGNFSNGNNGFSSAYTYNASSLWNEGTYAVTTNANNVHSGFTGTGAGNFLVVNGSTNPGSQVWCQEVEVTPNTLYNFSSLVNTVAGVGSPAILQFSINGTVIGTPFTAPTSLNTWEEFNASWNSNNSTIAEICIVNQNTTGSGNDFGLDNITFTTLCQAEESITVTQATQLNASISAVDVLCDSDNAFNLNAVDDGGVWSGTGITNEQMGTFSPSEAGAGIHHITYDIYGPCGDFASIDIEVVQSVDSEIKTIDEICENESAILLEAIPGLGTWSGSGIIDFNTGVFDPSDANIGQNIITFNPSTFCINPSFHIIEVFDIDTPDVDLYYELCFGDIINLNTGGQNFMNYEWSTGEINSNIHVNEADQYSVNLTDYNGCKQELEFNVIDKDDCEVIVMPNVFTPNNDSNNDLFIPIEYAYVPSSTIKIFNRWGIIVYQSDDLESGWNGKHFREECAEGVYFWSIDYQTNKGVYSTMTGAVNLLR